MERDFAALKETAGRLSPDEMTTPGPDGWSVKDHLAHIASWQRLVTPRIQGANDYYEQVGKMLGVEPGSVKGLDIDAINVRLHERDRALPLDQVLAELDAGYRDIVELVAGIDEETLRAPAPWNPENRLLDYVTGDTYEHYQEHKGLDRISDSGPPGRTCEDSMTTTEMLAKIEASQTALLDRLSSLSDDELTAAGHEGWSVKDHLAHLAAWERILLSQLSGGTGAEVGGWDESRPWDINAFNDSVHDRYSSLSLDEVRREFGASHEAMLAKVRSYSDEELSASVNDAIGDTRPVIQKIAGDTYEHYAEHRGWIENLLGARQAEPSASS